MRNLVVIPISENQDTVGEIEIVLMDLSCV